MKRFLFLSCTFIWFIFAGKAQGSAKPDTVVYRWKKDFSTGINMNQASFSKNWKAGGSNTFATAWFLNQSSKYDNNRWRLNSDLIMQLGFLQNKTQPLRKNLDRIFYEFKAGTRIGPKWDFFGSTSFQTQFLRGVEYGKKNRLGIPVDSLVSNLFAPAYLTTSMGFEVRPNKIFYTRFGVGSLRQTFVFDRRISNAGLFGVEPGNNIRNQFVLQLIVNYDKDVMENVNVKARYAGLFDYFRLSQTGTYVHRIDANITMKVNKYVNANVQAILLRDRDQDPRWQFSQAISMGVMYRLNN